MQTSDIPGKLPIPFGNSAGGAYIRAIPVASQIGVVDGAASLTTGFPPLNFQPIDSGGIPPNGADFNGILFEISGWSRWASAGGPVFFDSAFSTAIGGYPKWAILASAATAGAFWVSLIENNTINPDSDPTNWLPLTAIPATLPELIAGVNTVKYVTPATLAGLRASSAEVIAGTDIAKYITPSAFYGARASGAEVRTGTDDHKYITPAGLAAIWNSSPGIIYYPNGLIYQYGMVYSTFGEGNYTGSYNTPFPTQVDNMMMSIIHNSSSSSDSSMFNVQWKKSSSNNSTFAFKIINPEGSGTTDGYCWSAWGR